MQIDNITIRRIVENKWHIWFASCVIDWALKLSNIAIFKRLNKEWYRLVFPEKKVGEKKIQLFFPLTKEWYDELEISIVKYL
jgi:hypothetical protein